MNGVPISVGKNTKWNYKLLLLMLLIGYLLNKLILSQVLYNNQIKILLNS